MQSALCGVGCRHFRPDDKRIVQEISVRMQRGELQRVKSLHPNGGPLSKELMRPSYLHLDRPSFINSGLPVNVHASTLLPCHTLAMSDVLEVGLVWYSKLGLLHTACTMHCQMAALAVFLSCGLRAMQRFLASTYERSWTRVCYTIFVCCSSAYYTP